MLREMFSFTFKLKATCPYEMNSRKKKKRFIKYCRHENETFWIRLRIIFQRWKNNDFFPGNC